MSRLKFEDIKGISDRLVQDDEELVRKTGRNLRGIACHCLGIEENSLQKVLSSVKIAVVPQEGDQETGEIFARTVGDIIRHLGFKTFVTGDSNVTGLAEAVENGAGVIMMSDAKRFVALNIKTGRLSGNTAATAKGFVAGLDLMAGGIKGKRVFITGCGTLGWNAALTVLNWGAEVAIFDIDFKRTGKVAGDMKELTGRGVNLAVSLKSGLRNHRLIMETTNAAGIVDDESIKPETFIAAPGIPLGLTPEAFKKASDRLLHDQLQMGVAVMALEAAIEKT